MVTPSLFVSHMQLLSDFPTCVYTHLADSGLQHSIQPSFRCVHVSGDALAFDHARELGHIPRHAEDVVEAMGRTTADLIITGERQRRSSSAEKDFNCNIQECVAPKQPPE